MNALHGRRRNGSRTIDEWCPNACSPPSIWVTARWPCATSTFPNCPLPTSLVEVSHCGICGTDLHLVLEQVRAARQRARPRMGGHDRGDGCRSTRLGARRAGRAGPVPGCGECRACHRGPTGGVPATRADRPPRLDQRRVLPVQGRPRITTARAYPNRCRRGRPRSPNPRRSRFTPSTSRVSLPKTAYWSPAVVRSAC